MKSTTLDVVSLSKCDLVSPDEVEEIKKNIINIAPHTSVLAFINLIREKITAIKNSLLPGIIPKKERKMRNLERWLNQP